MKLSAMDVLFRLLKSRLRPFEGAIQCLFRKIEPGGPQARRVLWYKYFS